MEHYKSCSLQIYSSTLSFPAFNPLSAGDNPASMAAGQLTGCYYLAYSSPGHNRDQGPIVLGDAEPQSESCQPRQTAQIKLGMGHAASQSQGQNPGL